MLRQPFSACCRRRIYIKESNKIVQGVIIGCIQKDRVSQHLLYKEYYSYCMAICRRYAIDDDEAADVLNDGFLKVFTHISKYDFSKPFKPWLARIMTNTAIDHYRSNLKFSVHEDLVDHENIGHQATVYGDMAYRELLGLVQGLSPAYRLVFNLFAIDGYSHEEISEMLNISVGTSKSNLFKARQKLQERLNDDDDRMKTNTPEIKIKYGS